MTPEAAWVEAMKFENRADPYRFFDELRKTPVARVAENLYVVTGYKDLITLSHDPRLSADPRTKAHATSPAAEPGAVPGVDDPPDAMDAYTKTPAFISSDPPDHDRVRRQAQRQYGAPHSPDVIPNLEPTCHRVANAQLDKAKADGKTRLDVVDDFAYPLPVTVICELLGVPVEDEKLFHAWIAAAMDGVDLGPEAATEEGQARLKKGAEGGAALRQYITALIDRVSKTPAEGMLSRLAHDDGPDGRMTPSELVSNTILLLVAGHDSTVNLISHCVLTVLRNPGSIELLRRRPELIPGAVEEVLRLQSSVQFFPSRSAAADIEIAGTVIPKGASVFLMYGAANRDPERFPNPNQFDPARPDNEHLGWGSGVHTCFGGPLPRLEVNIAFETFLRRVENPRLVVDPPPYRRNQIFRGPRHLLIDFDGIRD